MAQPQTAEAHHARTQIMALGAMLDDVAGGRTAAEVHQVLMDAFDGPHDDSRIDGVEVGQDEFTDLWTALRHGTDLPDAT